MPDNNDTTKPAVTGEEEDVNLNEELDALNAGSEETASSEGSEPTPAISTPDQSALTARLDKLEEENISLRQRVDIQNGQISILKGPAQKDEPAPPERKRIRIPSREELAQKLSNPDTAVEGMHQLLSDLGNQMQEMVDESRVEAEQGFRSRDANNRLTTALQDDQRTTIDEYGQDLIRDPEFIRDADTEGDKLARRRGHTNYTPGDFNLLATRTYKNWLESGKLDDWKAKRGNKTGVANGSTANARPPSLREVTRSVGRSDFVDTSNGRGTEASSLSELYDGDPREIRIARANMKRMGLTEKEWVASFRASRSEDPSFGK